MTRRKASTFEAAWVAGGDEPIYRAALDCEVGERRSVRLSMRTVKLREVEAVDADDGGVTIRRDMNWSKRV
jgi:hypothetical protein